MLIDPLLEEKIDTKDEETLSVRDAQRWRQAMHALLASLCRFCWPGVVYTSQVRGKAILFPVSKAQPEAKGRDLSAGICKK